MYSIFLYSKCLEKNIYISVSFTFPSVVGKPTSYSRHVPDDIAHTISVRWQTEGIMILPQKGSGDIREVKFLWRSKAWPEETFLDSGMWWTNTNHIFYIETVIRVFVSMKSVTYLVTLFKGVAKSSNDCLYVISCQVHRWSVSILN